MANPEFSKKWLLSRHSLLKKNQKGRKLLSFNLELTARCNLNCRHCDINLPMKDVRTSQKELSIEQIERIADEAVSLGALWCLVTGGEPLVRRDFPEVYLALKKKGLLVSVFTNATLLTEEHIRLFQRYPPRDIEVTVYGATRDTYERVTRRPGSFGRFMHGLDLLFNNGLNVRLKAMALRSNRHELGAIARFCREHTKDFYRFDPFLNLRFDADKVKNRGIRSERLSPAEIVAIERADPERSRSLQKHCGGWLTHGRVDRHCNHLFSCGAGNASFTVSYDGFFRLCSSLWHPDCIYDLKQGSLAAAWDHFVPAVRGKRSDRKVFLKGCATCSVINLCLWCPAHAHLENGTLDLPVRYFCEVAHARAKMLKEKSPDVPPRARRR